MISWGMEFMKKLVAAIVLSLAVGGPASAQETKYTPWDDAYAYFGRGSHEMGQTARHHPQPIPLRDHGPGGKSPPAAPHGKTRRRKESGSSQTVKSSPSAATFCRERCLSDGCPDYIDRVGATALDCKSLAALNLLRALQQPIIDGGSPFGP